jgi:hypothetical protein
MRGLKVTSRLASSLFYALSLLIVYHAYPIAAHAYNSLCSMQGMRFAERPSASAFGVAMIIFAVPLLLSRGNFAIAANFILSSITIAGALSLLETAGAAPYECFTSQGTYDDNTSGLSGFEFWLLFAAFLMYVFLLSDLTALVVREISRRYARARSTA